MTAPGPQTAGAPRTRARGLAGGLALAAGAVVFSLLAGEAVFRIFGLGPPAPPASHPEERSDERKNSLGYRGAEWPLEKPPGATRILFVGDSFTYGRGVEESRIFASVAGARLSADGRSVEVLNISKPGWDTADEVDALEKTGLRYHPDLVVLVFFLNDATHLDSNPVIAWRMNRELWNRPGTLNRISRLYDTLDYTLRKRRITEETLRDYRESYLGSGNATQGWERCRAAFERGRDLCAANGARMAVVIFPMLVRLGPDYPFRDIHEQVVAACRELGLPVLDLLGAFEGRDGPSLWLSPDNSHPGTEGHAIAGEAIAAFLSGTLRERGADAGAGARDAGAGR